VVLEFEQEDEHGESIIVEVHSTIHSGDEMLSNEYTESRPTEIEEVEDEINWKKDSPVQQKVTVQRVENEGAPNLVEPRRRFQEARPAWRSHYQPCMKARMMLLN
jgi:hypothetical protein